MNTGDLKKLGAAPGQLPAKKRRPQSYNPMDLN